MSVEKLVMFSLPTLLLGLLIGRILMERVSIIGKLGKRCPIGIPLGLALAILHFVIVRDYAKGIVIDPDFGGIDPKYFVCIFISSGIFLLDMDLLVNSRFRRRGK